MDPVTAQVRALYEKYPYPPPGPPVMETGSDVRWLLSRTAVPRQHDGPLTALDAGCGRGRGLIAAASLQPDVRFVGVDISRVSLQQARAEAKDRRLANVSFHEANLMDLSGLESPAGGFDVIYSGGVVHHLSDPATGLRQLLPHLAPHGVLVLMVYSEHGRAPVRRLSEALDELLPPQARIEDRVTAGRALVEALPSDDAARQGPWVDVDTLGDVEFVDRYLHPSERYYTVDQLHTLVESAGLSVLDWVDPHRWSLPDRLRPGLAQQLAQRLPPRAQARVIERLFWERTFEVLVTHPGVAKARVPSVAVLSEGVVRRNPEAAVSLQHRATRVGARVSSVTLHLGASEGRPLSGPVATAARVVADTVHTDHDQPAGVLIERLAQEPGLEQVASRALRVLVQLGLLYVPSPGA